jgi:hypothetical protein
MAALSAEIVGIHEVMRLHTSSLQVGKDLFRQN